MSQMFPSRVSLEFHEVYDINVLRVAEKYSQAPHEVEEWPEYWFMQALELIDADQRLQREKNPQLYR